MKTMFSLLPAGILTPGGTLSLAKIETCSQLPRLGTTCTPPAGIVPHRSLV